MEIEERIAKSETRQFKVIIPNVLNANNTLFGGIAMQWMDEVAYITATRFTRQKVVTVSSDKINFKHAVPYGTIAEIIGKIVNIRGIKIDIQVEVFVEEMFSEVRFKAINAIFTFVVIDDKHKPIKIDFIDKP